MTIEEAIEYLERCADGCDPAFDEAVAMAIAALRTQAEAEKNEPLTPEELREMDGEPAYLHFGEGVGEWVLVQISQDVFLRHRNGILASAKIAFETGGKLYRRKPEEGTA